MVTRAHTTAPIAKADPFSGEIIVAHDLSPFAETALSYALDLAKRRSSEIALVYVDGKDHGAGGLPSAAPFAKTSTQTHRFEQLAELHRSSGVSIRPVAKFGKVTKVLAGLVDRIRPKLLFMGAYGKGDASRAALGSTTESLLQTLPCPVVAIGPRTMPHPRDPSAVRRIICPIDFPEDVEQRLKIIVQFARLLDAEVHLVHAIDVSHEYSRPHSAIDKQFDLDHLVGCLLRDGIEAHSRLLYGTPEDVICKYATERAAEYIVFGLHKIGSTSSYFRESLVNRVIRKAPCAVFIFSQPAVRRQRAARVSPQRATETTWDEYPCSCFQGV